MGAFKRGAYGNLGVGSRADGTRRKVNSHRHAYELVNGPIPAGMVVRHKCDVKLCCNPDHLEIGTHADNVRDKVDRGRSTRGEAHGAAKLTFAHIGEMRAKYEAGGRTQKSLAAEYGVSRQHVGAVVAGKTWRWVAEDDLAAESPQ